MTTYSVMKLTSELPRTPCAQFVTLLVDELAGVHRGLLHRFSGWNVQIQVMT